MMTIEAEGTGVTVTRGATVGRVETVVADD